MTSKGLKIQNLRTGWELHKSRYCRRRWEIYCEKRKKSYFVHLSNHLSF